MDTLPPQLDPRRFKWTPWSGVSSNTSLFGTQQRRRHHSLHRDAANEPTKNMTQDAHLKIVRKTGSSTNNTQHAVGCEYIDSVVNGRRLPVHNTAGVCRELLDECIAARNGNRPSSNKAFVHQVREIKHDDVVSSGIFAYEFPGKHPREWKEHALFTL